MKRILYLTCWLSAVCLVLAGGCAAPGPRQLPICPGKATVDEALAALSARGEQAVPFRANGSAILDYYDPDGDRQRRHRVALQLWFDPPTELYIQGSIGLDSKAVIVGSNAEEFWLALRPDEIDAYYWGRWDEAGNVEGLLINPRLVLEAFGIIVRPDTGVDSGLWSLSSEGPYDVLSLHSQTGELRQKTYVYTCDYLVHRIEYFDPYGALIAVAELEDYATVVEDFLVPRRIRVTTILPEQREDSIDVRFSFWRAMKLSEKAREVYFNRNPDDMERFSHVYRYEDGQWLTER